MKPMDPVTALRQIAYYKVRAREDPRRVMAYRKAADVVEALTEAQRERLGATNGWQSLPGIGPKTAKVIAQAWAGREPDTLVELRSTAADLGGGEIRVALRGDLHVHSNWSDGSAPIEEMMIAARDLGHEYCALTDHSPRLRVANGLSPERLREQLDVIEDIREIAAPMRSLTGIEVDILEDGTLDQEPDLLQRLDVVVASVHSKLAMDAAAMTRRMVKAVTNPHTDVLGHCTGRLVTGGRGTRPESKFDAEKVFTACRDHGTAVEINSRPERRDPPDELLDLAWRSAARSASTPIRMPRVNSNSSVTALRGHWAPACPQTASSTPGPPSSCWAGPHAVEVYGSLIGQQRHFPPGIAAHQDTARQRPGAEPLPNRVDGAVDRDGIELLLERQLQLLSAVAVDVGYREADEGQPPFGDQRCGVGNQATSRGEERSGRRGGPRQGARAGRAAEISEAQPQYDGAPGAAGRAHPAGDAVHQIEHDDIHLGW